MALVRAPYIHSKPELWKSGCSDNFSVHSESAALPKSHQHISSPPNEAAMDMSKSAYNVPPQDLSAADEDSSDSEESYDEQSSDKGLRRSFSTPNTAKIQQQGAKETQSQSGAAADKKRNKLGYHRTSIACSKCYPETLGFRLEHSLTMFRAGHCRRRKIRCIASPDVPNRCVNCIRLKKECSFYPVDQQPSADNRSRGPPRQATGSSVGSTTSSPAVATGSPGEMPSHQSHAPVSGIAQGGNLQTAGDEYFPPDVKG